MALAIKDAGVTPELEVFETGHLLLAKKFIENGYVKGPGMFQICLGIAWGQPATPEAMSYMRSLLPQDSPWFAFGISLHQFPMVAQAVLLGGHPRVGMEDNIYLEKGKLAPSNAALVEKAGKIIEILGDQVATPNDAREILGPAGEGRRQRLMAPRWRGARLDAPEASISARQGLEMAGATGLEPAASGVTGRRSNQLSYAPARGAAELNVAPRQVKRGARNGAPAGKIAARAPAERSEARG